MKQEDLETNRSGQLTPFQAGFLRRRFRMQGAVGCLFTTIVPALAIVLLVLTHSLKVVAPLFGVFLVIVVPTFFFGFVLPVNRVLADVRGGRVDTVAGKVTAVRLGWLGANEHIVRIRTEAGDHVMRTLGVIGHRTLVVGKDVRAYALPRARIIVAVEPA